jgi:hypothetical protein
MSGLILILVAFPALAQETGTDKPSVDDIKQANNPLADITSVAFHNYYKTDLIGLGDATANTFWFRYIKPVGRWLTRTSLPINYVPDGLGGTSSGTGDLNSFASYLISKPGAEQTYGVGPLVSIPTSTNEALSSRKYQLGAAAIYFNMKSAKIQYGGLLTYQRSFSGTSSTPDVSTMVLQPFAIWQLGKGTYLRSTGVWYFDLENDTYNVPFGLGVGKVLKVDRSVFNLFLEPQFAMFNKGVGSPAFQIFAGINIQFTGKGKSKG